MELSLPGTFAPGSECSMELSLPGANIQWNFRSQERKFHGTFVPWNEITVELSLPKWAKLQLTHAIISFRGRRKCLKSPKKYVMPTIRTTASRMNGDVTVKTEVEPLYLSWNQKIAAPA